MKKLFFIVIVVIFTVCTNKPQRNLIDALVESSVNDTSLSWVQIEEFKEALYKSYWAIDMDHLLDDEKLWLEYTDYPTMIKDLRFGGVILPHMTERDAIAYKRLEEILGDIDPSNL